MAVKKLIKRARAFGKKKKNQPLNNAKFEKTEKPVKLPKQKKTLVIAQEIKFARVLASNDKKARAKMLKKLRTWISVRSQSSFAFTETDFLRLWKGLFYCMWMSDKPLVQEELAESISHLVHCFESMDSSMLYTKCSLITLGTEWFGIDQYRIDKFQMLVRRILRQTFEMCKKQNWDSDWTKSVSKLIEEILVEQKYTLGYKFHIVEIYMEELAKVSEGEIPENMVTELLRPFAIYLASMEDERQIRHTMKYIFRHLIFQSDVGMDYMEKFEAWSKAGFPTGNINAMQKVELSDEEEEEEMELSNDEEPETEEKSKPLDPRAGRVDVELPQIPFDPQQIADLIQEYKFHESSTTKTRRQISKLVSEFTDLAEGKMPLGIQEVSIPTRKSAETNPKKAAYRLMDFEKELYSDTIRRKRRKDKNGSANEVLESSKKSKKPKLNDEGPKVNGFDTAEENEILKDKKIMKKSKKVRKTTDSEIEGPLSPKKKSVHQELKAKVKKIKSKKSKSMKNCLSSELMDGIDDFEHFKKSDVQVKQKKTKPNLDNSWDISASECPPTPTTPTTHDITKVEKSPKSLKKSPEIRKLTPKTEKVQMRLQPVITNLGDNNKIENLLSLTKFKTPKKSPEPSTANLSAKKKVTIVLQRNTAQATSEYMRQLRLSPQIPYDANRKPLIGVLKPSPLSSPVNPFYKKL